MIEDAAHAHGSFLDSKLKAGTIGDLGCFSFFPTKVMTTGEGGMITTNNREIYRKLLRLRSHGINKYDDIFKNNHLAFTNGLNNPWYYEMQELGYNFRITDIQSALGESQLKKLNNFIARRLEIVKRYDLAFKTFKNINPIQSKTRTQSSHHIYPVRINFKKVKISRAKLMKKLS